MYSVHHLRMYMLFRLLVYLAKYILRFDGDYTNKTVIKFDLFTYLNNRAFKRSILFITFQELVVENRKRLKILQE